MVGDEWEEGLAVAAVQAKHNLGLMVREATPVIHAVVVAIVTVEDGQVKFGVSTARTAMFPDLGAVYDLAVGAMHHMAIMVRQPGGGGGGFQP